MAVRFESTGNECLTQSTALPGITSFTMMAWAYIVVSQDQAYLSYGADAGTAYYLWTTESVNELRLWNGSSQAAGSSLTTATWSHVAMTVAGTGAGQFLGYLNGVLDSTMTGNGSVPSTRMQVGGDPDGGFSQSRMAAVKVWSAVLTADEIAAEMRCMLPLRTANLHTWSPLLTHDDVADYTGVHTWTVSGTLSTEDGPPIPWAVMQEQAWVWTAARKSFPPWHRPFRVWRKAS